MTQTKATTKAILPSDYRYQLGGLLFLLSLVMFFLASIVLYGLYAYWRRDDPQAGNPLPLRFLLSTICLLAISALVHLATHAVRREQRAKTATLLAVTLMLAMIFMGVQFNTMRDMLEGTSLIAHDRSTVAPAAGQGLTGMILVLAFLHALHVAGGIIALGIVAVRAGFGRYDHERHWPVDFAAQYWHFLDLVWVCMLLAFWLTSGGFRF